MQIKKNEVNKILTFFLFAHLIIWTLIPGISNNNLPLDTIEALAWGSNLDWGFNKHPPLSAFAVEIFYEISSLFFLHSVNNYLKDNGEIINILPRSILSGKQHRNFRDKSYYL